MITVKPPFYPFSVTSYRWGMMSRFTDYVCFMAGSRSVRRNLLLCSVAGVFLISVFVCQ